MLDTLDALTHSNLRHRITAMRSLINQGEKALFVLTQALKHPTPEIRWRTAAVLGGLGDPRAIPALAVLVEQGDVYAVMWNVAWALGQINEQAAIPPLLALVHSEVNEPDIRYVAALALARLGQTEILRRSLVGSPEAVYRVAHAALASIENPS